MSSEKKECSRYFLARRGFARTFEGMREKWLRYGRAAGKIKLSQASEEERRELGGFLGKTFLEDSLEFSMAEFEKALSQTRYSSVSLKELLEEYFGEPMVSHREQRAREEQRLQHFWEAQRSWWHENGSAAGIEWIEYMIYEKNPAYSYVAALFRKDAEEAERSLQAVCQALEILEEIGQEEIQLAVLAARISGNPHFMDQGEKGAQLLRYALCCKTGEELPKTAEEIQQLYELSGVVVDQISSTVTVSGIHMVKRGRLYAPLEEMNALEEPMTLSLRNLKDVERVFADVPQVLVVENEMVYSHLLSICLERKLPILCTSGQLSRAAQKILRFLCAEGTVISYGGDTDPEGLQIADNLWQRYPEQIHLWRMSPEDYERSKSQEILGAERLEKLTRLQNPKLRETAERMRIAKTAGYQENLIEALEGDLRE